MRVADRRRFLKSSTEGVRSAAQSWLRKQAILSDLPEWPENPKSAGKGKRVRCDVVQTEVIEGVIHQLLEAGAIPAEIG